MPTPVTKASITISQGWYDARRAAGYTSDAQLAVAMDVNPTTVYRVQAGEQPSARFIAAALLAMNLREKDFSKIFRVVPPAARRPAA